MQIPKITSKKYMGDDKYSWAIFIDGKPFVTGLMKREINYYIKQAKKKYEIQE